MNDALPTGQNIQRKGIDANSCCLLCRKAEESVVHIFWRCKFAEKLWENIIPKFHSFFLFVQGQLESCGLLGIHDKEPKRRGTGSGGYHFVEHLAG